MPDRPSSPPYFQLRLRDVRDARLTARCLLCRHSAPILWSTLLIRASRPGWGGTGEFVVSLNRKLRCTACGERGECRVTVD